jgi:hypothetical protein
VLDRYILQPDVRERHEITINAPPGVVLDVARGKFRRYWRKFGIGVAAIRRLMLPALRREAERRWRHDRGGLGDSAPHPLTRGGGLTSTLKEIRHER